MLTRPPSELTLTDSRSMREEKDSEGRSFGVSKKIYGQTPLIWLRREPTVTGKSGCMCSAKVVKDESLPSASEMDLIICCVPERSNTTRPLKPGPACHSASSTLRLCRILIGLEASLAEASTTTLTASAVVSEIIPKSIINISFFMVLT